MNSDDGVVGSQKMFRAFRKRILSAGFGALECYDTTTPDLDCSSCRFSQKRSSAAIRRVLMTQIVVAT